MSRYAALMHAAGSFVMFGFLAGLSGGFASTVSPASMSHGLCVAGAIVSGILCGVSAVTALIVLLDP